MCARWTGNKVEKLPSPVYDGHKLYAVRATYAGGAEAVTCPAGKFATSKSGPSCFDRPGGNEERGVHVVLAANSHTDASLSLEAVIGSDGARGFDYDEIVSLRSRARSCRDGADGGAKLALRVSTTRLGLPSTIAP